jgi:hypothetical protein
MKMNHYQLRRLPVEGHCIDVVEQVVTAVHSVSGWHWFGCTRTPVAVIVHGTGSKVAFAMDGAPLDPDQIPGARFDPSNGG